MMGIFGDDRSVAVAGGDVCRHGHHRHLAAALFAVRGAPGHLGAPTA